MTVNKICKKTPLVTLPLSSFLKKKVTGGAANIQVFETWSDKPPAASWETACEGTCPARRWRSRPLAASLRLDAGLPVSSDRAPKGSHGDFERDPSSPCVFRGELWLAVCPTGWHCWSTSPTDAVQAASLRLLPKSLQVTNFLIQIWQQADAVIEKPMGKSTWFSKAYWSGICCLFF